MITTSLRPARVAVLAAAAVLTACSPGSAPATFGRGTVRIATGGRTVVVHVEVASTDAARREGLMGRSSLGSDDGMVFVFAGPVRSAFWMKDTTIPLSIAFWDGTGRIVAELDMAPCRGDPCPLYRPGGSYVGALEVNRGFFAHHGIGIGARVELTP